MNNDNEFLENVGKNIKNYRKKLNFSQEQLSNKCKINRSYLSEIEKGTRNFTILTIKKIASSLNTDISTLISYRRD